MWEFRGLTMKKSASKGKAHVNSAAPDFKNTWNKLSKLDKLVLSGVLLWSIVLVWLFTVVATESDSIDIEYYDDVKHSDTEKLA